jgi:predicted SAM-dependent methyltransferase
MKIHLGCGRNILDGYINVDSAPFKIDINSLNVDPQTTQFIQSDAISFLSYLSDKNIDEIKSEHFLEHLTRTQMCRLL